MTDKKRRQRGSRTHGGGSGKNRRGAGHRGGRGRAGRDKHEFHNYEPLGKEGFTRPEAVGETVETVNLRELDEDAAVLAAEGLAEATDEGYRIDARDVVEDGHEVDVVKVLGGGRVRNDLTVVADAFSDSARAELEATHGEAVLSERGRAREDAQAGDEGSGGDESGGDESGGDESGGDESGDEGSGGEAAGPETAEDDTAEGATTPERDGA